MYDSGVFGARKVAQVSEVARPHGIPIIGQGGIVDAVIAAALTGSFLANVDFGRMLSLPLPKGFALSTSFIYEVAICLTVLGAASMTLGALGHPKDAPDG